MKVAFDTRDLALARTGIRTVLEGLIEAFKDQEVELLLLSPKTVRRPENKFEKIWEHVRYFFWKEVQLPLTARSKGAKILFCNDYVVPYFSFGVKTFPFFHGTNFWEFKAHYNPLWRIYFSLLSLPAAKKSAGVFVNSEFTKLKVNRTLGIREDKLVVLPLAPKPKCNEFNEVALTSLGIKDSEYILHVGVFEKRKNLVNLIRAFNTLKNKEVKLVLVGQKGPKDSLDDYPRVVNEIETLGLEGRVVLPGHVNEIDLATFYLNAKLYVFPSFYEGFGIPVLEAFQYDVPVITSSQGALPEIVGENGLYFDGTSPINMAQVMDEALEDKALQERLLLNGRERLKNFSWALAANKMIKVFKEAAGNDKS